MPWTRHLEGGIVGEIRLGLVRDIAVLREKAEFRVKGKIQLRCKARAFETPFDAVIVIAVGEFSLGSEACVELGGASVELAVRFPSV